MTTANSARSMRRRRSNRLGKNEPWRSLGMASSTSPAAVDNSLGRCPLRCVVRVSARSWRPAPMKEVASDSISCWRIHSRLVRTVSVTSPALSAARSSDRSESVRVTGGSPFVILLGTRQDPAGGPPSGGPSPTYTTPGDVPTARLTVHPLPQLALHHPSIFARVRHGVPERAEWRTSTAQLRAAGYREHDRSTAAMATDRQRGTVDPSMRITSQGSGLPHQRPAATMHVCRARVRRHTDRLALRNSGTWRRRVWPTPWCCW